MSYTTNRMSVTCLPLHEFLWETKCGLVRYIKYNGTPVNLSCVLNQTLSSQISSCFVRISTVYLVKYEGQI